MEEAILHELDWSSSIKPKAFRTGWNPLPRSEDGSFHLQIPLDIQQFLEWSRLGWKPNSITLNLGAVMATTAFQSKEMNWEGVIDFDPILLSRKEPLYLLHSDHLSGDLPELMCHPDFDSKNPGVRLIDRGEFVLIFGMVAKDGVWQIYLGDGQTIPPDPQYFQLGYVSKHYFRKDARAVYSELDLATYKLTIAESFRERHGTWGLTVRFGGLPFLDKPLSANASPQDAVEFQFQAPTEGVCLTVEDDGRSFQSHIYPLKPGEQVLE